MRFTTIRDLTTYVRDGMGEHAHLVTDAIVRDAFHASEGSQRYEDITEDRARAIFEAVERVIAGEHVR